MNREARRGKGRMSREGKKEETKLRTGKTTENTKEKLLEQRPPAGESMETRHQTETPSTSYK